MNMKDRVKISINAWFLMKASRFGKHANTFTKD